MNTTHTPGPWQAIEWTCHAPTTVVVDDYTVVTKKRVVAECDNTADARLIAAAPDLLDALQAVLAELDARPHIGDSWLPSHLVLQVRVAVANATQLGSRSQA
jgi:hypothetical protein